MARVAGFPGDASQGRALAALLLVAVAAAVAHAGPGDAPAADTVRARRLEVVDEAGRVRIALSVDTGPRLMIYDAAGGHRIALALQAEAAPGLEIFTAGGTHAVQVRHINDQPLVSLHGPDGLARFRVAVAGADADAAASAAFLKADGSTVAVLPEPKPSAPGGGEGPR
jgi:hypothetical protein